MALEGLATDSVDLEPYNGSDEHGNASFGTKATYSNARNQQEGELTRDDDGNEVMTTGVVYIMGADATADANPQARITLPDGSTEEVIRSAHKTGLAGALEHTKVWY